MSDPEPNRAAQPAQPSAETVRDLVEFVGARSAEELESVDYADGADRLRTALRNSSALLGAAVALMVADTRDPRRWHLPWDALVEMALPWSGHPGWEPRFAVRADGTTAETEDGSG
ncbi:hypothetical protein AB0D08_15160 [Kitasatospora sp. NPDC048540]|uniref:hypothetical protein n=1 Tax=unclassified Kitasatospora TaxID=2633591 RepID=UPI00053B280B|nr:hypothetical protein [Kitasatospora sp. MBT63]